MEMYSDRLGRNLIAFKYQTLTYILLSVSFGILHRQVNSIFFLLECNSHISLLDLFLANRSIHIKQIIFSVFFVIVYKQIRIEGLCK